MWELMKDENALAGLATGIITACGKLLSVHAPKWLMSFIMGGI